VEVFRLEKNYANESNFVKHDSLNIIVPILQLIGWNQFVTDPYIVIHCDGLSCLNNNYGNSSIAHRKT